MSRVAQYRIPAGGRVRITDPAVLASLPPLRLEKLHLNLALKHLGGEETTLIVPALAASFGPSIAGTAAAKGSFALSQPALPLRTIAGFQYGCEPHRDVVPGKWGSVRNAVEGQVLVLRRGKCSFARKAHLAALGGAKAIIVVNSSEEDESAMVVPSAEGEEAELRALVPLVLVSNSTGERLEALLVGKEEVVEARVRPEEPKGGGVEPLVLGGYQVWNVQLERR